ncbi:MAG: hypothetical protein HRU15_14460, partial [Planctomycetes bacterium]|nr:hypothetical protein [Planctomycetota bacterium]
KEWLFDRLPGLRFAPCIFTCALNGLHVEDVLKLANEMHAENQMRCSTSALNEILENAVARRRPKKIGPSYTKIYYATQVDTAPPTFTIFVNRTDWIEPGYSRYLENFFRKYLEFKHVPFRIIFKARKSQYHENKDERERMTVGNKADRKAHLIIPKGSKNKKKTTVKPGQQAGPQAAAPKKKKSDKKSKRKPRRF